ncbi:MAG: hypothetical protein NTW87_29465 [Planctomycetota bacterium]|nr:hypothetical protein [Planctomycetota bacterium]
MKDGVGKRLWVTVLAVAALVPSLAAIIGCVADQEEASRRPTPPFPHKRHVIEEEMKCAGCHRDAEKADQAGLPTKKSCTKCHEGTDEKRKPNELQIKAFFTDDKPLWSPVTPLPKEAKFSHKLHWDAKVQCETCHTGIATSQGGTTKWRATMRDCLGCHAKLKVGANAKDNCGLCHTVVGKQWKPPTHQNDWKRLHGRAAGFVRRNTTQDCYLCHTEKTCVACHRDEKPKSHTNYWRERGHGVESSLDRSSCRVCHTEDFCVRCHQSVAPRSHRANFDSRHCMACHLPLKDETCIVCHKSTPSHAAAPRLPTNLDHRKATSSDCRTCHFGLKMRHFDNGDDCLSCHKR